MTAAELEASIAADPDDIHEPMDWTQAVEGMTPKKRDIHIRIDENVLDWFRRAGRGGQTRINHLLRVLMEPEALKRFRCALDEISDSRLKRVVLFGSRARGNARDDSNYDPAACKQDKSCGKLVCTASEDQKNKLSLTRVCRAIFSLVVREQNNAW